MATAPIPSEENKVTGIDVPTLETTEIVTQNSFVKIGSQMRIMLKRNFKLQFRYYKASLCQAVVAPILLMILLLILQAIDYNNQLNVILHPTAYDLGGIKNCISPLSCVNLIYTPSNEFTDKVMKQFNQYNKKHGGDDLYANGYKALKWNDDLNGNLGVGSLSSESDLSDFVLNHPNQTLYGVQFFWQNTGSTGDKNIKYQIWYNASIAKNGTDIYGDQLVGFARTMDETILSIAKNSFKADNLDQQLKIDLQLKDWPQPKPSNDELSDRIVKSLGPLFFFCMQIAIFLGIINTLSTEKNMRLRNAMEMMGLKPSVYFSTWFITVLVMVFINALTTGLMGLICGFEFFKNCDFSIILVLYTLFGMAMVSLGFAISSLFRNTSQAILCAIFVIIIALFFQLIIFGNSTLGYIWWSSTIGSSSWLQWLFCFLPWFNFGKIYIDISQLTTGTLDPITRVYVKGPGYTWDSVSNKLPSAYTPRGFDASTTYDVPPTSQAMGLLFMNICLYYFLSWYFDKIIPDEFGSRQPVYFLFTPRFWKSCLPTMGGKSGMPVNVQMWLDKILKQTQGYSSVAENELTSEQDDVKEQVALAKKSEGDFPIRVLNLRKQYGRGKTAKVAVKSLCFVFPRSKLLALLGKNGAGKSTTMNIIAGLAQATSGDGLIYNYSIADSIGSIQSLMGICPQFDLLFADLTASEHIELYAELKNVPKSEIKQITEDRLKAVRLWSVKDRQTRTYSGGMKRRLSMVIATIGNPKIVILDEPTTGMDPVNRRYVWQFIEKFKENRVIILTSHSMEEADILGDQ
eukprot:NODE_476_length_6991_cov_0.522635.p1 type:complete len:800 gc:universal NODE_476_length_6991_cov_0.522635:6392-3993(-)